VPPQISATPGMPERKAAARRQARVRENLHLLPKNAQEAILESFEANGNSRVHDYDADTASIPTQRGY
jgi:phospholipid/cholesterol/gamma-HCH transport system ATP-binding protein